jgi:hypothetical protein
MIDYKAQLILTRRYVIQRSQELEATGMKYREIKKDEQYCVLLKKEQEAQKACDTGQL